MRQNFGWALSNFSSAGFSEEKHFPALLLFINELTSDITKHPNNRAASDLQYINKWWCLWKILQTFFQGCGKPSKEKKKKKRKKPPEVVSEDFCFWGAKDIQDWCGMDTMNWRPLLTVGDLGARERQISSQQASLLPELADWHWFVVAVLLNSSLVEVC